jgi:hypothetical protein
MLPATIYIYIPHPLNISFQIENGPSGRLNLDVDIPRSLVIIHFIQLTGHRSGSIQVAGSNSGCVCRIITRRGEEAQRVEAQTSLFKAQRSQLSPLSSLALESTDYEFVSKASVESIRNGPDLR